MDRRSFIKSTAALGSGLFVSFSYADNKAVASGHEIVNPWLQIAPDNSATVFEIGRAHV